MKEANSFPDWFKNILIAIGAYSLLYFVSNYFAKYLPLISLSYPLVLYFIMLSEGNVSENWKPNRAKHFTNISFFIIGFITIVQLFKVDYYVTHAGKIIFSGNEFFLTNNYYGKVAIYIFTLLFSIVVGTYLTIKTARKIESFDGIGAFQAGKKLWSDIVSPGPKGQNSGPFSSPEYIKKRKKEALELFDKAIAKGYDKADAFSLRGSCLNDLGFYFDAIEDYDKAIDKNPKQGIASNYHMRSLIKDTVSDYEGSLTDIEEAIRLSKLDNDDNEFWNEYAKKTLGYNTATQFYEWHRDNVKRRLELNKGRTDDRTNKLKYMKRRHE